MTISLQSSNSMAYQIVLLLLIIHFSLTESAVYDVTAFGAKPDGASDSSRPFLAAWAAACGATDAAVVHVPSGTFYLGPTIFSGPCKNDRGITVQMDGKLVAPSGYTGSGTKWDWLLFDHVEGVSVIGGTIDGRGAPVWSCKADGGNCPRGATSLRFLGSKNVMISGLTSVNSELYHIVLDGCQGATVQNVKISAPGNSPNTDGVHVQTSTYVAILGTGIKTGDDCISIGPGTANLWIEQVSCGPGHGISIGSLGKDSEEQGVQNVTVKTTVFTGTENGLRIKTWGRPSDGFVKGVVFEHSIMQNVRNPIIIDQNYCPDGDKCPDQSSGVKISQVTYSDIQGSSASQVAVDFDCSSSNPCSGIDLQDIKLTYGSSMAEAACKNAKGTVSGAIEPPSCL